MNIHKLVLIPVVLVCLIIIAFAGRFTLGSLYKLGLENELDNFYANRDRLSPEAKQQQLKRINQLSEQLVNINPYDSDHLSLAAYVQINNFFNATDELRESALEKSALYNQRSILSRPIFPDTYAQQAYVFSYEQRPLEEVLHQLELADRTGPFEYYTAEAGLEILFTNWDKLPLEDKMKAVKYLVQHNNYGLTVGRINQVVVRSNEKNRLCEAASYANIKLNTCR